MYEIIILKEGYTKPVSKGLMQSGGSVTLLKGPQNIIVDTGSPWDKDLLLEALRGVGLSPKDVGFSICTHGGADKVGNLNLFPNATHIVGNYVCRQGSRFLHGFEEAINGLVFCFVYHHVEGLKSHGVPPDRINYVICTHGHSDHVGNLNLFQSAVHIVSYDICKGDQYILHDFAQGIPYEIDDFVEVWPTPGHTGADVSVIVKGSKKGIVAITGDLFECQEDLEDPDLWQCSSEQPDQQEQSRIDVLRIADHIVPGHGPMFQVPDAFRKQVRVVMMQEERYTACSSSDGASSVVSETKCVVVEMD